MTCHCVFRIVVLLMAVSVSACSSVSPKEIDSSVREPSTAVRRLLKDGSKLDGLMNYRDLELTAKDMQELKAYCESAPVPGAFVPLMMLRERSNADYHAIHPRIRSTILCQALRHQYTLGDFGHLPGIADARTQRGGPAMEALMEGNHEENFKLLFNELDDRLPAPFYGSAQATESMNRRYRHCDYAEWACRRMLNEVYILKDDPADRDRDIVNLKARLLREGLVKSSTPIGL